MQVVVDSLLTNYQTIGNGKKVIICLHGWADSGQTFESLSKQLAYEYEVVFLDLPGFGNTQMPETDWQLLDYANFTAKFLKKLDIKPYAIAGHSNGGAIAISGLAEGIFQAEKLVLLSSAGIRTPNSARNSTLRTLAKPAKLILNAAPQSVEQRIKQKFYRSIGSDYMIAAHMRKTFRNIVSYDVRKDAAKLQIPALLIYGGEDTSTPPKFGKMLNDIIPDSKLEIVETSGHFVHQEQVYKVADLIKEFLK